MAWLSVSQQYRNRRVAWGEPNQPMQAVARLKVAAVTRPSGFALPVSKGTIRADTAGWLAVRSGTELGTVGVRYGVTGVVKEMGDKRARVVRAYRQDTGELLGSQMATGGVFSMSWVGYNGPVTVLAYDDAAGVVYNAQVFDSVTPI